MQTVERFTAWCACPSCDYVVCHLWREPKPAPVLGSYEAELQGVLESLQHQHEFSVQLHAAINGVKAPKAVPQLPSDESSFEVIRICRCGHEWGQG